MREITEEEVAERFRAAVQAAGGQRAFAQANGLTASYINDIMNSRRGFSTRVLSIIGIEVEVKVIYWSKE